MSKTWKTILFDRVGVQSPNMPEGILIGGKVPCDYCYERPMVHPNELACNDCLLDLSRLVD